MALFELLRFVSSIRLALGVALMKKLLEEFEKRLLYKLLRVTNFALFIAKFYKVTTKIPSLLKNYKRRKLISYSINYDSD